MKAALWLLDGTSLPGLEELILALAWESGSRPRSLARPAQPVPGAGGAAGGPRGRRLHSVRYYISSQPADAEALLDLIRGHGGVENGLLRTLDMQFREDDCRIRTGHAPTVMGILRRTSLNMLRTILRKLETDVSIGLLRDRIGRQP